MTLHQNGDSSKETPAFRVNRRNFLRAAGAGVAGTALATGAYAGAVPFRASRASAQGAWDQEADIVVIGGGAAALTAAAMAAELGNQVIVLEKAPDIGGTTAKSGGGYWIPANRFLQEQGIDDPREDAIKYMVRYSYSQYYNPALPRYGAFENDYALIETFYDTASTAVDTLEETGILTSMQEIRWNDLPGSDYMEHYVENKVPRGRLLYSLTPEGTQGFGVELIRQLAEACETRGVTVLTGHRAERLVLNDAGEVVGLEAAVTATDDAAATPVTDATAADSGETAAFRARKAVIFGSGGFTHDKWLALHFQRGPIYGGCAVPTNEGDLVRIAGAVGAKLGNMTGAFHAQIVLEQALEFASVPSDVFMIPGDSALIVNRFGKRVVNEKRNYNDRTQVHFNWDPVRGEWTNQVLVYVYDQRTADYWGGSYPIPAAGVEAPYLITGQTLAELGEAIDQRLADRAPTLGGVRLDSSFAANFQEAVGRFNAFAVDGVDPDFQRGDYPYDREWPTSPPSNPDFADAEWPSAGQTNPTMYPISAEGPYYAIFLGGGTLDTNGGPVINPKAQIVNQSDQPIPGLYGAGNCIASPAASAYWGGGATLGNAITWGFVAANSANEEPVKDV